MTVRYTTRGTGITTRNVPALTGDWADIRDTLHHVAASASLDSQFSQIEQDARTTGDDDHARRILRHVHLARSARARGDIDAAMRHAMAIGALLREAQIRAEWESVALSGARMREGAREGGRLKAYVGLPAALAIKQEFDARLTRARREGRRISATALAAQLAKERLRNGKDRPHSRNGIIKAIARAERWLAARNKSSTVRGIVDAERETMPANS